MQIFKVVFKTNVIIFSCLLSSYVYAAGSQLLEQDASDLGRAYAGGAITGDNAVIEFDNPAAMVQLKKSAISVVGVAISPHTQLNGTGTNAAGAGITGKPEQPMDVLKGVAFHYVQPIINSKLLFGFGITGPFAADKEYDSEGIARYLSTKNSMSTLNFNPSLAYAITDKFSVGAGVSAQYLQANMDQKLDTSIVTGRSGSIYDANIQNIVSDWGYGYNLGLAYNFTDATKMGLSYRSAVRHRPSGDLKVDYPSTLTQGEIEYLRSTLHFDNGKVRMNYDLPATYLWSLSQKINSNWDAMATVAYTNWSHYSQMTLHYSTGLADTAYNARYHDSWRFALGTDYKINEKWLVRFGTAYDSSPTDDNNRQVLFPDSNRFWLACGMGYTFTRDASLDLGYAHVFIQSGKVNDTSVSFAKEKVNGNYNDGYANALGLQFNWKFS